MPKVSVIIPFHNRIKWLTEAVQSVLDQTYTDSEIILVDDGSTEDITSHIDIGDERIRYVRQENKGPAAARNHGIDLARGCYVAFLDSDDLFLPTKLEKQVTCMEEHPDILLSHTSYQRISAEGEYIEEMKSGTLSGRVYPEIILHCPITTPTVMIRREGFSKEMRFEESIQLGEDTILWMRFAKKSEIMGLDEPLTKVRMHGNNATLDLEAQIIGRMNVINHAIKNDRDLTYILRRKLLSSIYFDIGIVYFRKREKVQSLGFLIRAIIAWPLNYVIYKRLLSFLVKFLLRSMFPNFYNTRPVSGSGKHEGGGRLGT
jgi:glycosyltransferase involved in cell wall biosynthesis